jgi:hypothetical protein
MRASILFHIRVDLNVSQYSTFITFQVKILPRVCSCAVHTNLIFQTKFCFTTQDGKFDGIRKLEMYVKIAEFVKGKHIYVNKIVIIKIIYVTFEIFTAVTIKNAVLWVVAPCRFWGTRLFGVPSLPTK